MSLLKKLLKLNNKNMLKQQSLQLDVFLTQ